MGSVVRSVDRSDQLRDFPDIKKQRQKVLVMRKSFSFSATVAALFIALALASVDVQASFADEAPVVRHKRAATALNGHRRHHWRELPVVTAPVAVGVVTSGRLTTEFERRSGYSDPYYGYYGGPVYYGGPYYYPPYYDGVSSLYYATHPIVEW